jgi:hypothetical protein
MGGCSECSHGVDKCNPSDEPAPGDKLRHWDHMALGKKSRKYFYDESGFHEQGCGNHGWLRRLA